MIIDDHVAAVKAMVEEDARVTVAQLEHDLGISLGSVHRLNNG